MFQYNPAATGIYPFHSQQVYFLARLYVFGGSACRGRAPWEGVVNEGSAPGLVVWEMGFPGCPGLLPSSQLH